MSLKKRVHKSAFLNRSGSGILSIENVIKKKALQTRNSALLDPTRRVQVLKNFAPP